MGLQIKNAEIAKMCSTMRSGGRGKHDASGCICRDVCDALIVATDGRVCACLAFRII